MDKVHQFEQKESQGKQRKGATKRRFWINKGRFYQSMINVVWKKKKNWIKKSKKKNVEDVETCQLKEKEQDKACARAKEDLEIQKYF